MSCSSGWPTSRASARECIQVAGASRPLTRKKRHEARTPAATGSGRGEQAGRLEDLRDDPVVTFLGEVDAVRDAQRPAVDQLRAHPLRVRADPGRRVGTRTRL